MEKKEVQKFHVGQPVRCLTDDINPPKKGEVFTISEIDDKVVKDVSLLSFEEFPDSRCWWAIYFEPAYKLEVGCVVKVIANRDKVWIGEVGIVEVTHDSTVHFKTMTGVDCVFPRNCLIVLEPTPRNIEKGGLVYIQHDHPIGKAILDTLNGTWNPDNYDKLLAEMYGERSKQYQKPITISTPHSVTSGHPQSDDSPSTYEDILKAMESIKNQPIDKYGLMALETLSKQVAYATIGIDWAVVNKPSTMEIQRKHLIESSIRLFAGILDLKKKIEDLLGGKKMKDIADNVLRELAEKMKDEYVGSDSQGNHCRGSVFLKKAGECAVESRDVSINLADSDVLALLKNKGIAESLGDFQIQQYSNRLTVCITKFKPLVKPEPENEED